MPVFVSICTVKGVGAYSYERLINLSLARVLVAPPVGKFIEFKGLLVFITFALKSSNYVITLVSSGSVLYAGVMVVSVVYADINLSDVGDFLLGSSSVLLTTVVSISIFSLSILSKESSEFSRTLISYCVDVLSIFEFVVSILSSLSWNFYRDSSELASDGLLVVLSPFAFVLSLSTSFTSVWGVIVLRNIRYTE